MAGDLCHGGRDQMLDDIKRQLEIGSHSERLRAVRTLGVADTREAHALLQLAADDIDPQIRDEAQRLMRESVWSSGSSGRSVPRDPGPAEEQESLF